ncbi:BQ2448_7676 [Microbotryum intermedium]|uniref:BQ2448_7676 protein n=1 Tax=Microbotryum intermedium TaxID=269621 RepID=A0A238FMY2_9BASI|nr:BQ2448_7676 [Microbotryum intermedium]
MADQATATSSSTSNRITQRQLFDAIAKLDEAFQPSTSTSSSSSSLLNSSNTTTITTARKRPRSTSASHHSTAALEALLPANSQRRKPQHDSPSIPKPTTYDPSSLPDLIERIRTYRATTFTPGKPTSIDPLHCSLLGWASHKFQRDQIECTTCHALVSLAPLPSPHMWASEPGRQLVKTYEQQLRQAHHRTCPWRVKGASPRLYQLPQLGRKVLMQEIALQAKDLQQMFGSLPGLTLERPSAEEHRAAVQECLDILQQASSQEDETTREHLLLSLFGWSAPVSIFVKSAPSTAPILECRFCTRTVLLSPYLSTQASVGSSSSKSFDVIQQHQSFCPYVSAPILDDVGLVTPVHGKPGWEARVATILQRKWRGAANSNPTLAEGEGSIETFEAFEWLNKKHTLSVSASEDPSGATEIVTKGQTRELLNHVRKLLGPQTSPSRTSVQ